MSFTKVMSKINSGAASLVGSVGGLINGLTGVTESQDRTYAQQQAAMKEQNAYNTYMWNLANQYNTPSAQLARMADAGIEINPTSYALGTGNLSNTAGVVGSASGFSGSGSPAGNPITMAMGVANGIQGIRESKARTALDKQNIKNLKEQEINLMQQGQNLFNQTEHTRIENEIMRHNLDIGRRTDSPVGSMPSFSQSATKAGNEAYTWLRHAFRGY